jgi:sugar phosphate isomerase/epimerase
VSEGAEIVRTVNHKNFMLLPDIFHMLRENEGPESIIKHNNLLRHTHIAEINSSSAPGVNGEDLTPYLRALKEIEYKGLLSIECNWRNMAKEASPSLIELRRQIDLV